MTQAISTVVQEKILGQPPGNSKWSYWIKEMDLLVIVIIKTRSRLVAIFTITALTSCFEICLEVNPDKKFVKLYTSLQSTSICVNLSLTCLWSRLKICCIFLEYFNHWQNNFHEEFSFRLCRSSFHPFIFCFLCKCEKIWKRKDCGNIFCHLESYHMASKSSLFQISSFIKFYRRFANGSHSIM